jgi:2-polyprenyl-3-methyl-5-hydroxy-6-metoxy-1,4-benzoquinol methylase
MKAYQTEIVSCPVCNTVDYSHFLQTYDRFDPLKQKNFQIVQCTGCQFIYLNPRPTEKEISRFYQVEGYDPFISTDTKLTLKDKVYLLIRQINLDLKVRWISQLRQPGRLLDVGCATGEFLRALQRFHWDTWGVETDQKSRDFAIRQGVKVCPAINTIPAVVDFDVITLWHVLEHIYTLRESLIKLISQLKPGGKLILAVPNIASFDFQIFHQHWVALDAPRHLYHFSKTTLDRLMRSLNLKIQAIWPLPFDLFYNFLLSRQLQGNHLLNPRLIINMMHNILKLTLDSQKYASSLVYLFEKGDEIV